MDLATFKGLYPDFKDDLAITSALSEAGILITTYNIDEDKLSLATAYLTAHLLALRPASGATEQVVTMVKSGTNEVKFSDKVNASDWLAKSSYGEMLKLLIKPDISHLGFGGFVI